MVRLRLLGGQVEEVRGVVIDHVDADRAHKLRNVAMAAQAEWFANPESADHKRAYARALRRLGLYTLDYGMVDHAETLLSEAREAVTA